MQKYSEKYLRLLFMLLALGALISDRIIAATDEYLSPISVVAGVEDKVVYVVAFTANRVAVFDIASDKGIENLVGVKKGNIAKSPVNVNVLTSADL